MNTCPHCESTNIVKHGFYKSMRRYSCKNCLRTFTNKFNSVSYNSKKTDDLWLLYCKLFNTGYSLRACSSILQINIKTAFSWRHKILRKLSIFKDKTKFNDFIGLRVFSIFENRKGQKNILHTNKLRNKFFIGVTCTQNHNLSGKVLFKNMFFKIKATNTLLKKINLSTSPKFVGFDTFSKNICNLINKNHPKFKPLDDNDFFKFRMKLVLAIFNYKKWLKRFRGISTKYFEFYFHWYGSLYESIHIDSFNFPEKIASMVVLPSLD